MPPNNKKLWPCKLKKFRPSSNRKVSVSAFSIDGKDTFLISLFRKYDSNFYNNFFFQSDQPNTWSDAHFPIVVKEIWNQRLSENMNCIIRYMEHKKTKYSKKMFAIYFDTINYKFLVHLLTWLIYFMQLNLLSLRFNMLLNNIVTQLFIDILYLFWIFLH